MAGVIVNEWLEPHGGVEKVMEEMAGVFPDAPIFTLWDDAPERFQPGRVTQSWLARTPLRRHKGLALPAMPSTWRHLGHAEADWILCSSHLFAHHARFSGPARVAPKLVYAYTPARYIWNPELDARGSGALVRAVAPAFRAIDRQRAQEPQAIAAISEFVRRRIENAWHRESTVIYPPVNVGLFSDPNLDGLTEAEREYLDREIPDEFILGASRFIPYKRLDLVIRTGAALGIPTVVAGSGPEEASLRSYARENGRNVTFVIQPSVPLLRELFRRASVFVFPPVEDFGIVPVEAMATGTPVIARSVGGASETVIDGQTGALIDSFDSREVRDAFERAMASAPDACATRALDFDSSVFRGNLQAWVQEEGHAGELSIEPANHSAQASRCADEMALAEMPRQGG